MQSAALTEFIFSPTQFVSQGLQTALAEARQHQLRALVDVHFAPAALNRRLQELPQQLQQAEVRPWQPIVWSAIHPSQVVGMELQTFLQILAGAINTEAPIRGYTQTSRQYLENLFPNMARLVGGLVAEDGTLLELGLWEKEERRHTPALLKIYRQLSSEKLTPQPHAVRVYQPSDSPEQDLFRHGLHRIATEYGAACLYLWLMAYTTGPLRDVLEELATDEITHLTNFLGFGAWAYPRSSWLGMVWTILRSSRGRLDYHHGRSSLLGTLQRMTDELHWSAWTWEQRRSFIFTCNHALYRLWVWRGGLNHAELEALLG
jgi:hypothetical protein